MIIFNLFFINMDLIPNPHEEYKILNDIYLVIIRIFIINFKKI